MVREQTFTLLEATLALYPAGSDGEMLSGIPVWFGGCAENLKLRESFNELLLAGTGDKYRTAYHVDEDHAIEIGRIWVLPLDTLQDFTPGRNQRYVMELVWQDERTAIWHKRTYYGVTFRGRDIGSRGVMESDDETTFRAQRYVSKSDFGIYSPIAAITEEQPVPFFHDGALLTGEYFTGHYQWSDDIELVSAKVISRASQGQATTLTLEVDGVLTALQLVIPEGGVNVEVNATVDLGNYILSANSEVRWVVTDAPAAAIDCAWTAAVVMQVKTLASSGASPGRFTFDQTTPTFDQT